MIDATTPIAPNSSGSIIIWLVADGANIFVAVVIAFVVSGLGSYFLLDKQREAFARRVEARAARATKAFKQLKAKEDAD